MNMDSVYRVILCWLILMPAGVRFACGQTLFGSLVGNIEDASDAVIAGAYWPAIRRSLRPRTWAAISMSGVFSST